MRSELLAGSDSKPAMQKESVSPPSVNERLPEAGGATTLLPQTGSAGMAPLSTQEKTLSSDSAQTKPSTQPQKVQSPGRQ